jgi:uncharacterized protein (DUF433 family)
MMSGVAPGSAVVENARGGCGRPCFVVPVVNAMTTMKPEVVSSSPDVMGGALVFTGTRVPVQTFLDYLKSGYSIDDFLEGFPIVSKKQLVILIEEFEQQLKLAA